MPNETDIESLSAQVEFLSAQVNRLNINQAPSFEMGFANVPAMNGGVTTTLTAAITTSTQTAITVASGTSFTNPAAAGIDYALIDNEVIAIMGGGGTTSLTIARGQLGTVATTHANGAIVDNSLYQIAVATGLNRLPRMMTVDSTFVEGTTYIGICKGTHLFPDSSNNNHANEIYNFAILEAGTAIAPPAGNITTLSAAITSTAATSISVTSGVNIVNGQYIQIAGLAGEIMKVVSGGGTSTLKVLRAQFTSKAMTALNGSGVANAPTGYVIYFLMGGNGYRAWITANTHTIWILCQQVGSGFAAQLNITFNIFA
jgi:hypothetical protein